MTGGDRLPDGTRHIFSIAEGSGTQLTELKVYNSRSHLAATRTRCVKPPVLPLVARWVEGAGLGAAVLE